MTAVTHEVWFRKKVAINTDPQRRCYDGCNFSERVEWTAWGRIVGLPSREDALESARTYKEINPAREYEVRPVVGDKA